jgi:SPP1 family predicted phage head-tail adaptor
MKFNKNFSRYNDGVVSIYREKPRQTDFSAKQNVSVLDDMDFIVKLSFEELSKREQDLEFAQQNGFTLSLKIKTRLVKNIDNKCKAVINNYLYDVSEVDKNKSEIFLYLEGVKELDS